MVEKDLNDMQAKMDRAANQVDSTQILNRLSPSNMYMFYSLPDY